jgi:pilus assembly protein Flp/PilA
MLEAVQYIHIRLVALPRTPRGASAVEYGLLVALIGIAIVVAVTLLGTNLKNVFTKTANSISK